jgi:hypothetical protein
MFCSNIEYQGHRSCSPLVIIKVRFITIRVAGHADGQQDEELRSSQHPSSSCKDRMIKLKFGIPDLSLVWLGPAVHCYYRRISDHALEATLLDLHVR